MYKFTTIKCSGCGAVIYNLPEPEAKKIKNSGLKCEDCTCRNSNLAIDGQYFFDSNQMKCINK